MSITVLATFQVKAEKVEDFLTACRELTEYTMKDKGVQTYELQRNNEDTNLFVFVERWESQADLDAHLATEHIKKAFPIFLECCQSEPVVQVFSPAF
ncbi:antibiotic biosynthesis monooxygenase [Actinobacillus succinogenes]|uniref:Antibiotic biosynthesis monooxygenase n=1 Tax=Actinobacillus succinogenes (strain ATCC 55618 / DSM 22257 / CCUG 43843 / 130Z) TaxID=339671 RepID=A6VKT9_ACTSZ|nr:putative quinol monooxygenase [Actinobacillus succinogenes]ABR73586.1 Antibiotic biosynthesis monooxygenase [Actinobacillus succinogenes 130Z]PHI39954.1 antibiotic biosynthesis monooxygenase [Actinobacillus succinogenes]